jgi:tRNA (adenine37-N6)-methyltransferase
MHDAKMRPGEVALAFDPAQTAGDAHLVFIGRAETPWPNRDDCPKNIRQAREAGRPATLRIDPPWRPGLEGLEPGQAVVVLLWMHRARRDLILQAPRHRDTPAGVFALRSPVRPNPIGLAVVAILEIDREAGRIVVDALDCADGTPILDIKPWIESVDLPPGEAH